MALTRQQKKELIAFLNARHRIHKQELESRMTAVESEMREKLLRRLNAVSVKLWTLKISEVLTIERRHRPELKRLVEEVMEIRRNKR